MEIPKWVELLGDGPRAAGFEKWMQSTVEGTLPEAMLSSMTPERRAQAESRLRIAKILVTAVIEANRSEEAIGVHPVQAAADTAEVLGFALAGLASNVFIPEAIIVTTKRLAQACERAAIDHARAAKALAHQ